MTTTLFLLLNLDIVNDFLQVASFLTELVLSSLQKFSARRKEGREHDTEGNAAKTLLQGQLTILTILVPNLKSQGYSTK